MVSSNSFYSYGLKILLAGIVMMLAMVGAACMVKQLGWFNQNVKVEVTINGLPAMQNIGNQNKLVAR